MEVNLLFLRVYTSRYPTAVSLHRMHILRYTSLNHIIMFCTSSGKVRVREITVEVFYFQDDSVVPVDINGFKQYDSKETLCNCVLRP